MCDYFWQRMEEKRGDLADIVDGLGVSGRPQADHFFPDWQLPVNPIGFISHVDGLPAELLDPFSILPEPSLPGPYDADPGLCDPGRLVFPSDMVSPCSIFSRMMQISPAEVSPMAVRPSTIITGSTSCLLDNDGEGMQISSPRAPGLKRRKSQAKKVVCIPASATASGRPSGEVVPSDLWAWRKYGQKPIKGSPYPRGYYRCSSSKGCSARKQVERSRTDPNMLVITYTSEHNHPWPTQRNALAGSTRAHPSKNTTTTSKHSPHLVKAASSTSNAKEELEAAAVDTDDFFSDLAELETDPTNLIFSKIPLKQEAWPWIISSSNEGQYVGGLGAWGWGGRGPPWKDGIGHKVQEEKLSNSSRAESLL